MIDEFQFTFQDYYDSTDDYISAYVPSFDNFFDALELADERDKEAAQLLMDSLIEGGVL